MNIDQHYQKTKFVLAETITRFPKSFAIITAHNPMDKLLTKKDKLNRNKKLVENLQKYGKKLVIVIGTSTDRTHQEESYLIEISLNQALEQGRIFEQRAIFWVKDDKLLIIDCKSETNISIGNFSKRLIQE